MFAGLNQQTGELMAVKVLELITKHGSCSAEAFQQLKELKQVGVHHMPSVGVESEEEEEGERDREEGWDSRLAHPEALQQLRSASRYVLHIVCGCLLIVDSGLPPSAPASLHCTDRALQAHYVAWHALGDSDVHSAIVIGAGACH